MNILILISQEFPAVYPEKQRGLLQKGARKRLEPSFLGMQAVKRIQEEFHITSTHLIKPGVGETTRVLLRRVPWKILMRDPASPYVKHILMLAEEKGVEVVQYGQFELFMLRFNQTR